MEGKMGGNRKVKIKGHYLDKRRQVKTLVTNILKIIEI